MNILFLHPYSILGDWNTRIRRQLELMREAKNECSVFEFPVETNELGIVELQKTIETVKKCIDEFGIELFYVNGFLLIDIVKNFKIPVVYDMGSFKTRNNLINKTGDNINELIELGEKELIHQSAYSRTGDYYRKEKEMLEKANAIITWEGNEVRLVEMLFGKKVGEKIYPISMMFSELPEPIPFENKEKNVIAIAPKWGDLEKDFGVFKRISTKVKTIGHGGNVKFVGHKELIGELNRSRVLFCPYKAGGCGVVSEGLRLGCNVVTMQWYPFNDYINDEMKCGYKNIDEVLLKALEKNYPTKKEIPSEKEQINKILGVCQNTILAVGLEK